MEVKAFTFAGETGDANDAMAGIGLSPLIARFGTSIQALQEQGENCGSQCFA